MQLGSEFNGSKQLETSVANAEILDGNYYKFSLMVDSDCSVSLNGSEPIFLRGGLGFSTDQSDVSVHSVKFLEDGIPYFWIGGR